MQNSRGILNALPVFVEAAKQQSFTKASNQLGMAQPSVSRFISILENHIGTELFERDHNRIALNEAGQKLFDVASVGLSQIERVIEELQQGVAGTPLSICCSHGFYNFWLQQRLNALKADGFERQIYVSTTDNTVTEPAANNDCTIHLSKAELPNWESHRLFDEVVFPVCSPTFAQSHGLSSDMKNPTPLLGLPLLFQDIGQNGWPGWKEWFGWYGLLYDYPAGASQLGYYAYTLQAAMADEGIALMWGELGDIFLEKGWLIPLSHLRVSTQNGYYVSYQNDNHKGRYLAKSVLEEQSRRQKTRES